MTSQIIHADYTWLDGAFQPDVRIAVGDDGRIAAVGGDGEVDGETTHRLEKQAVLPGFVNAHSHAFQRGLRGYGETFPKGAGSFWSWREAMYGLVGSLDAENVYELSHQAFQEMLAAGITSVGEFHYIHHDASNEGYAFDDIVLRAASDVGVRIVLLNAYYNTGGIGEPLKDAQLRFRSESLADYWRQMDGLQDRLPGPAQTLGVVAHSIRAAPLEDIQALHAEASRRGLPFHFHIEEQPAEIAQCIKAYGERPMTLLAGHLELDKHTTAVHCTHTLPSDLETFIGAGGTVCICPLTEANLGDGIPETRYMLGRHGQICLGTDSNARIAFTEEMRWLEYAQRLTLLARGVCVDEEGRCAAPLLKMATELGAASLSLEAGLIEPGRWADLQTLDLTTPSLAGWTPETLLESYIFGCGNDVVCATCVGGVWSTE